MPTTVQYWHAHIGNIKIVAYVIVGTGNSKQTDLSWILSVCLTKVRMSSVLDELWKLRKKVSYHHLGRIDCKFYSIYLTMRLLRSHIWRHAGSEIGRNLFTYWQDYVRFLIKMDKKRRLRLILEIQYGWKIQCRIRNTNDLSKC